MTSGNVLVLLCWMVYDSNMSQKQWGPYGSDGDKENVIRAIGLKSKTTILHVYHTFLYNSLPFF